MSLLVLIGRLLFAAIFLAAAPRHFTAEAAAHAAELGVPLARLAVPASGLLALAGGLGVLAGYHTRLGAWLLVAFLVPVTVMMHAFWRLTDPVAVHTQQAMFMKNVAMIGDLPHSRAGQDCRRGRPSVAAAGILVAWPSSRMCEPG